MAETVVVVLKLDDQLSESLNQATAALAKMQGQAKATAQSAQRELQNVSTAARGATTAVQTFTRQASREFSDLARTIGVAGAVGAGTLVGGLTAVTLALRSFSRSSLDLHYTAQELKLSTESLTKYAMAGQTVGLSYDQSFSYIKKFAQNMLDLQRGPYSKLWQEIIRTGERDTGYQLVEAIRRTFAAQGNEGAMRFIIERARRMAAAGRTEDARSMLEKFGVPLRAMNLFKNADWLILPKVFALNTKEAEKFSRHMAQMEVNWLALKIIMGNALLPVFNKWFSALEGTGKLQQFMEWTEDKLNALGDYLSKPADQGGVDWEGIGTSVNRLAAQITKTIQDLPPWALALAAGGIAKGAGLSARASIGVAAGAVTTQSVMKGEHPGWIARSVLGWSLLGGPGGATTGFFTGRAVQQIASGEGVGPFTGAGFGGSIGALAARWLPWGYRQALTPTMVWVGGAVGAATRPGPRPELQQQQPPPPPPPQPQSWSDWLWGDRREGRSKPGAGVMVGDATSSLVRGVAGWFGGSQKTDTLQEVDANARDLSDDFWTAYNKEWQRQRIATLAELDLGWGAGGVGVGGGGGGSGGPNVGGAGYGPGQARRGVLGGWGPSGTGSAGGGGYAGQQDPGVPPGTGEGGQFRGGTNMGGVDPKLISWVQEGAKWGLPPGYTWKWISGRRSGGRPGSYHRFGGAGDIQIFDPNGNPIPNDRAHPKQYIYDRFGLAVRAAQERMDPKDPYGYTYGGHFRSGHPFDLMHMQRGGPSAVRFNREAINAEIRRQGGQTVAGGPGPDRPFVPGVGAGAGVVGRGEDPRGLSGYIREVAARYGIDPDTAVAVAKSEGLRGFKSSVPGEQSYTAFQLNMQGGLGNEFFKETGLDPRNPKNERAAIDWALRYISKHGWSKFHGARNRYGLSRWAGIGGRPGVSGSTPRPNFNRPGVTNWRLGASVNRSTLDRANAPGGGGAKGGTSKNTTITVDVPVKKSEDEKGPIKFLDVNPEMSPVMPNPKGFETGKYNPSRGVS